MLKKIYELLFKDIKSIIFFVCITAVCCTLIYLMYALIKILFIISQKKFDDEYFERREKLGYDYFLIFCPFKFIYTKKIEELSLPKNPVFSPSWLSSVNNKDIIFLSRNYTCPILMDVVYEIFDEFKNPESQFHKKLFDKSTTKLKFLRGANDIELETVVMNILNKIPSKDKLSLTELIRVLALVNEKAIDWLIRNPPKYQEFLNKFKSTYKLADSQKLIEENIILLSDITLIELYLQGLCNAFNIKIKVYDARKSYFFTYEYHDFTVEPESSPIKEYTALLMTDGMHFIRL